MNVAVLGASNKTDRYSYKAVKMLQEKGYRPFPVHPVIKSIDDIPVYASLEALPERMDTITVYLSAENTDLIAAAILDSGARRVIFNPGAENPRLAERLSSTGVEVFDACTLVLLVTNQF